MSEEEKKVAENSETNEPQAEQVVSPVTEAHKEEASTPSSEEEIVNEDETAAVPTEENVAEEEQQPMRHSAVREKNQQKSNRKQRVERAPEETMTLEEMMAKLTNKNDEYIFKLRKALNESDLPAEKVEEAINIMIPEIITGQRKGQTARQLYGPVSLKLNDIINAPESKKPTSFGLIWMDLSLMFLFFMAIYYAVITYTNPKNSNQVGGILTLVAIAILAGGAGSFMNRMINDYRDKKGDDRPKRWQIILYGIIMMVAMFIVVGLIMIVAQKVDFRLDPMLYIIIGLAAFGLRYFLKRRFKITGTLF